MSELYLVAHKVRGEPAFDIATRMDCPLCNGIECEVVCHECDSLGFWWIIPTSGHRAFPYWDCTLADCLVNGAGEYESIVYGVPPMPESLPDHYPDRKAPSNDLSALLAALPKAPSQPIKRR